ncbi:MAG: HlyD family efflux transporter periplasmic adaptor subunit [Treponema sp.]|nr:HlyD family efflux transporter periplasmic adaptor subunit [Treponema sp.]MCL2250829.1 HlyD family efflux transporter periplasmic adaptor subunit [Treponema sp.]
MKKDIPVKKIVPILVLLTIIILILFNLLRGGNLKLQGVIEGTIYSQITEVSGKIIEMNVQLGSRVKAGDLIARLDSINQQYTLEQLQIALEKTQLMSQEELIRARSNVNIAEANYRSAQASFVQARNDLISLEKMFEIGGIARIDFDNAKHRETLTSQALEASLNQLQTAQAHYSFLQNGMDNRNITQTGFTQTGFALAEIDIRDIESRIRQMQDMLQKYEIKANCDGILISINYNMGSMVNAGYNIADISAENEKFVVFYFPNEYINKISYGQKIKVKSGSEELQGEVRYIDVRSQYTPKDMQTSAMKNKFSVKIKLLLPSVTALIPGNKVEVFIK